MDPQPTHPPLDDPRLKKASRFREVFRSWFWRYYDSLGHLIFYNILWVAGFFLFFLPGFWMCAPMTRLGLVFFAFFGLQVCLPMAGLGPLFFVFMMLQAGPYLPTRPGLALLWAFLFYLVSSVTSVGGAYLTFRAMSAGECSLKNAVIGWRRYAVKGTVLALLSLAVVGLALFSLRWYLAWPAHGRILGVVLSAVVLTLLMLWIGASFFHMPLMFFQDPPLGKILYRSLLLFLDNSAATLFLFAFCAVYAFLFMAAPPLWLFLGSVFFASLQAVALEKILLKYKMTYQDQPLGTLLDDYETESRRGWRDIFRPWESK